MNFDKYPEIQRLAIIEKEAYEAYMAAKRELYQAKVARCGVAVGDIVRATSSSLKGTLCRVAAIEPDYNKGWVSANIQLKDGSYGTGVRHLFDHWEKVTSEVTNETGRQLPTHTA